MFVTLYLAWAHNAAATLSLSLLAQAYEHAHDLLNVFASLEITVAFLMDIDRLVRLLESPIFTYLRLQLLDLDAYPFLAKCLYGLLMLLPQGQAFQTLHALPPTLGNSTNRGPCAKTRNADIGIHFDKLLAHFNDIQTGQQKVCHLTYIASRGNFAIIVTHE